MAILPNGRVLSTTFASITLHVYCLVLIIVSTLYCGCAQAWTTDILPALKIKYGTLKFILFKKYKKKKNRNKCKSCA